MSDPTNKFRRAGEAIASSSRRETYRSGHTSNPKPTVSSSSNIKPRNANSSKSIDPPELTSITAATPDDERTYNRLLALGMPSAITLVDFARIMNPPRPEATEGGKRVRGESRAQRQQKGGNTLRDALEFLSMHFVGREETRKVRACISRAREEHAQAELARPQSRIKAPAIHTAKAEDVLDDPWAVAKNQRDIAYRSLESAQREYTVENARIGVLDKQKRELARQLEDKRRIELLLRVLEKRETVRVARLGLGDGERRGMGALVRDLCKESSTAIREFQTIVCEKAIVIENLSRYPPTNPTRSSYKYTHTTNALANLHARHRRVVRGERESEAEHVGARVKAQDMTGDVEKRLEDVLGRLGVRDKAGLDKMKRTLGAVARRRAAARQQQYVKLLDSASVVDDTRLADMHRSNEEKRHEVQEKINRAVALGWLCEGYIDLVSTFRSETAPSLNEVLSAEEKRIEGYVDALRTDILSSTKRLEGGFAREVREVMGTTRIAVWDEVLETFGKVGASERLVSAGDLGVTPQRSTEQHEVCIDAVRNAKALERKATKAEYGFGMAEEVREMLADVKRLK